MIRRYFTLSLLLAAAFIVRPVEAAIIIDGTDANDHGSFNGSVNVNGWEYMQRVLENLAPTVTNGNKRVVVLGTSSGAGLAYNAAFSAFDHSSLDGAGGWTITFINGSTAISNYLTGGTEGGANLANTGILQLTTAGLSSGDLDVNELNAINMNATALQTFTSTGGGSFHAMGESGTGAWGWLTTLLPGVIASDIGGGGTGSNITLTAAGTAAFPGLTNTDLAGADPWHGYFSGNLGGLNVLGTATYLSSERNVIIGTGNTGGGFTGVPEPATCLIWAFGSLGLGLAAARRRRKLAA
jgi:MYXO-CTERM domain-containing protein